MSDDATPAPRLCVRCHVAPLPIGKRIQICSGCLNAARWKAFHDERATRKTAKAAGREAAKLAEKLARERVLATPKGTPMLGDCEAITAEPVETVFVPFPDGAPAHWPAWAVPYLVAVAASGGEAKPAYDTGVKPRDVKALRALDAEFAEIEADARDYYGDSLAVGLPTSKTPIGRIARLKSMRPAEYETALIVQTVNNNTLNMGAPPASAAALMQDFYASLDERRVKMLRGEVIDVPADVIVESGEVPA